VEHKGRPVLADLSDAHCTRCHRQLAVADGAPRFEPRIDAFARSHPEFRLLKTGTRDGAQVKLNHAVHLKPGLRGPSGPVQMVCADCHRPGTPIRAWPFGTPAKPAATTTFVRGAYMHRISYADHCIACHPLGFDPRTIQAVPHERPEAVRAFLRLFYLDYAAAHPDDLRGEEEERGGLRRGRDDDAAPIAADQWAAAQVAAAEDLLYRTRNKGCQYCHALATTADAPDALPPIVPTKIPSRWFAHARFDHRTHRELRCLACHEQAATSRETTDVLLPGIAVCRKCHLESAGARATCAECHTYHDKTRERPGEGPLSIPQLIVAPTLRSPSP
jgi:hypothetical protein